MIDRSTKIILIAIVAGLWANVAVQTIRPAAADSIALADLLDRLDRIAVSLEGMDRSLYEIHKGKCENKKLC